MKTTVGELKSLIRETIASDSAWVIVVGADSSGNRLYVLDPDQNTTTTDLDTAFVWPKKRDALPVVDRLQLPHSHVGQRRVFRPGYRKFSVR